MNSFDNVITIDMIKILKVKNEWLLKFLDNEKKFILKSYELIQRKIYVCKKLKRAK